MIQAPNCSLPKERSGWTPWHCLQGKEIRSLSINYEQTWCDTSARKSNTGYGIFFPSSQTARYYIDGTPDYIFNPQSFFRAFSHLPAARYVFVLRNPADRALSHYRFNYGLRLGGIPAQYVNLAGPPYLNFSAYMRLNKQEWGAVLGPLEEAPLFGDAATGLGAARPASGGDGFSVRVAPSVEAEGVADLTLRLSQLWMRAASLHYWPPTGGAQPDLRSCVCGDHYDQRQCYAFDATNIVGCMKCQGVYAPQLAMWLNAFAADRLYVIGSEWLWSNHDAELQAIASFLGIAPFSPAELSATRGFVANAGGCRNTGCADTAHKEDVFDELSEGSLHQIGLEKLIPLEERDPMPAISFADREEVERLASYFAPWNRLLDVLISKHVGRIGLSPRASGGFARLWSSPRYGSKV